MENNSNPVDYKTSNALAAIWSMMLPGLGQMMKGHMMAGVFWGFFTASGYFSYFWPGIMLHTLCVLDAAFNDLSGFTSWPKRLGIIGTVTCMIGYIFLRNHF